MMPLISQLFAFLFAISLLVALHEFGHFWVARRFGIKTLRFSIGFGRPIFKWLGKDGTEYVIAWLPLGGYVRLLDEREMEVPAAEKHLAFNNKSIFARALVLLAGPGMNWILAIILFWIIFAIGVEQSRPVIGKVLPNSIAAQAGLQAGDEIIKIDNYAVNSWQRGLLVVVMRVGEKDTMDIQALHNAQPQSYQLNLATWKVNGLTPDPLDSLGLVPYEPPVPPVVAKVLPDSMADKAGLKANDRITAINAKPINDWIDFIAYVQKHPGEIINLGIQRGQQTLTQAVTIGERRVGLRKIGFLGIEAKPVEFPANMIIKKQSPVWLAWWPAVNETVLFSKFNFVMLEKLVLGQLSMKGLGGPITIFTSAKAAFLQGLVSYLGFLGILSVMLACINILPIPGLDGGHLLFLAIEAVKRKPVTLSTQILAWRIGMVFLIVLMFQATINDIMRLVKF